MLLLTFQSMKVCPQLTHNKEDNYLVSQVKKKERKKKKKKRERAYRAACISCVEH